jgi:hypothetical protein
MTRVWLDETQHEWGSDTDAHRTEIQARVAELKIAITRLESTIDRRFGDLMVSSFFFAFGPVLFAFLAFGGR